MESNCPTKFRQPLPLLGNHKGEVSGESTTFYMISRLVYPNRLADNCGAKGDWGRYPTQLSRIFNSTLQFFFWKIYWKCIMVFQSLRTLQFGHPTCLKLYADKIYNDDQLLTASYSNRHGPVANRMMSGLRVSIEWIFGEFTGLLTLVKDRKFRKAQYRCLLVNCRRVCTDQCIMTILIQIRQASKIIYHRNCNKSWLMTRYTKICITC